MPSDEIEKLSVEYSYPVFAVKRLIGDYGIEIAKEIMNADTEMTTVRFNSDIDGEKYLTERRWAFQKTPFNNTFFVKGFKRNEDFDRGIYTFQSIGSVAICDMVESGENLLDACAAPGGKSVNLADKFSTVTSCELHPHRVKLIEEYAERMKKANVSAINADSSIFNEKFENKFDAVLCDVPCSGYGVVKDNPDIKLRREEKDIADIYSVQRKILQNCSKYLKKGGFLYYSTCSVFKSENEKVCLDFLNKNKDFKAVEIHSELEHKQMKVGVSFLPHLSYGAGFYFCKFKKV